jgi:predicted PilT family ATPase
VVEVMQQRFNELVTEQLETMDKLLYLQSEIERCQELEEELLQLQEMTKVESIKREIASKKMELKEIQNMFQKQTDEVIRSYQKEQNSVTT